MPLPTLLAFLEESKDAMVRKAAAEIKKLGPDYRKIKTAELRRRVSIVLAAMENSLTRCELHEWLSNLDDYSVKLVQAGVPMSRLLQYFHVIRSVFRREIVDWHGDRYETLSASIEIAENFFDHYLLAFAKAYEREGELLLREEELQRTSFFQNMIFPTFLGDEEGRILEVNPAMERFVGRNRCNMSKTSIIDFLVSAHVDPERVKKYWSDLRTKKRVKRMPLTIQCPERGTLHVEISSTFRRNLKGEIVGIQGFLQDMTHERDLEKMRDDLTHMIVHDLKNPLSAISLANQSLLTFLPEENRDIMRKPVDVIARSVRNMLGIIMNILDISRMEENKLDLKRKPVDPVEMIENMRPDLEVMAGPRALRLPRRRPMAKISFDEAIIRRVIENLFSNAVKHTPVNGRISIGIRKFNRGRLEISVTDNGEGIPAGEHRKIFEKFGQAGDRRLGSATDTGLGLTFCKLAIEAHGGEIRVRSGVDRGTTFSIHLPLNHTKQNHAGRK